MQNEWWMRPALQKSEAVLLPALPRVSIAEPRFSDRFTHTKPFNDPFRPIGAAWPEAQSTELSTYVRPRGSMAGRGVLRAAGISANPYGRSSRPMYAAGTRARLLYAARGRFC